MQIVRAWAPVAITLAILAVVNVLLPSLNEDYRVHVLLDVGINVMLAVSLNLVNGVTGQFSIGHAGFMALGGYTAAFLSIRLAAYQLHGVPDAVSQGLFLVLALVVGGMVAALAGLIVGLPSLRLRGDYLAIVTLGFGEIIRVLIENTEAVGGARGLSNIPPWAGFFAVYAGVFVTLLCSRRLLASTHGRALLAIREDEVAAEAMGVNTVGYKVRAFVVSAFFAGIAGGLYAHYQTNLAPKSFTFIRSIEIVVMVVLGGMGSISGSVLAAVVLTLAPELLRALDQYRMASYGLMLVLLMLARPSGIFGTREIWELWPLRKKSKPDVDRELARPAGSP
ncbi:MAG: branched-chain amino acid ABC transporter permease [Deltaproteobacteria bacterium]|nr:branched-chain amino acid ABC transporter permease [Deltaproteobacteria bacterium]